MENLKGPSQPPSLNEALRYAAKRGQERKEVTREAIVQGVGDLKERGRRAIIAIRERVGKVTQAVDNVVNISIGIAFEPDARKALFEAVRRKAEESGRALQQRSTEIGIEILDKGEDTLHEGGKILRAIRDGINERVIRPAVEGARKVGRAVVKGAEAGALFVATPAIEIGKATYSGIKEGYELGKKGVEKSKEAIERGRRKAEEWEERLGDFFQRQGEKLRSGIDRTGREIKALPYEVAALPRRAEAGVEGLAAGVLEELLTRLVKRRYEVQNEADRKRQIAAEIRSGGVGIKTRT